MEEQIETRVAPEVVWKAWERVHSLHGQRAESKIKYKILDVKNGESFSVLWKTLFVRLIFIHKVKPIPYGSVISYTVQIKGLFAWPVRFLIEGKIRKNIHLVLKAMVRELERY